MRNTPININRTNKGRLQLLIRNNITEEQRLVAEECLRFENRGDIVAICAIRNISQDELLEWLAQPAFVDYLETKQKQREDLYGVLIHNSLMMQCLAGDVRAMRLYYELQGKLKQIVKHEGVIQHQQIPADPALAEEYIHTLEEQIATLREEVHAA